MKPKNRLFVLVVLFLTSGSIAIFAQNEIQEYSQDPQAQYRLFRTTNIWTFIQLDTISGRMWQIQYSVQDESRGGSVLSLENLAEGKKLIPGRFTLYATSNMYNFLLVDQIDGSVWQVQWSFKPENRVVLPIRP